MGLFDRIISSLLLRDCLFDDNTTHSSLSVTSGLDPIRKKALAPSATRIAAATAIEAALLTLEPARGSEDEGMLNIQNEGGLLRKEREGKTIANGERNANG